MRSHDDYCRKLVSRAFDTFNGLVSVLIDTLLIPSIRMNKPKTPLGIKRLTKVSRYGTTFVSLSPPPLKGAGEIQVDTETVAVVEIEEATA